MATALHATAQATGGEQWIVSLLFAIVRRGAMRQWTIVPLLDFGTNQENMNVASSRPRHCPQPHETAVHLKNVGDVLAWVGSTAGFAASKDHRPWCASGTFRGSQ